MSAIQLGVEGVTKRFGGLTAVNDVSFALGQGDILSLIGPNGAGKTTLFNLLTGQLAATAGKVFFDGADITHYRPNQRARLGLGRTFQISQTLTSLSVLENAMIGAFLHHPRIADAADKAYAALERVGLASRAKEEAGHLTLGERRRLEVARALGLEPRLLLLDEVMAGLNQTEVARIVDLVLALNASGQTIIVIEHNLKVVRTFSKRVLVLDRGKMIADGGADSVLQDPVVVEAYVGKKKQ
ncbi:MAG: ABC transporter ATP-binding protein [Rhizobiales bacterium]|nr:ABC transporter ATP-binding protein [Hyphomicrobiales bacterium]